MLLAAAMALRPDPAGVYTDVVVVTADLRPGVTLRADDIRLQSYPAVALPDGALTDIDRLAGATLAGPVRRGEVLTDARVLGPRLAGLNAGPDARVVPLRLSDSAVLDVIRTGDVVDVLGVAESTARRSPGCWRSVPSSCWSPRRAPGWAPPGNGWCWWHCPGPRPPPWWRGTGTGGDSDNSLTGQFTDGGPLPGKRLPKPANGLRYAFDARSGNQQRKASHVLKGFREFLAKGNIIDLSVAVVIGTAFTGLVTKFTDSIITPLINRIGAGKGLGLRDPQDRHRWRAKYRPEHPAVGTHQLHADRRGGLLPDCAPLRQDPQGPRCRRDRRGQADRAADRIRDSLQAHSPKDK